METSEKNLIIFCNNTFVLKTFLKDILLLLIRSGYQVSVYCDLRSDDVINFLPIKVEHIGFNRNYGISLNEIVVTARAILKNWNACFIYTNPKPAFLCSIICFFFRRERIFLHQGFLSSSDTLLWRKQFLNSLIDHVPLVLSDRVISISPPLSGQISRITGKEKIFTLFPGSICGISVSDAPRECRQFQKSSCLSIGYFGRVCVDKGCEYLLSISKELSTRNVPHNVLIYGQVEDFGLTEKLLSSDRFFYCGYVNSIDEIKNKVDILLFPSRREGLGMALIEACNAGIPVLASRIPSHEYILNGASESIADFDVHEWCEKIQAIVTEGYDLNILKANWMGVQRFGRSRVLQSSLQTFADCIQRS